MKQKLKKVENAAAGFVLNNDSKDCKRLLFLS